MFFDVPTVPILLVPPYYLVGTVGRDQEKEWWYLQLMSTSLGGGAEQVGISRLAQYNYVPRDTSVHCNWRTAKTGTGGRAPSGGISAAVHDGDLL